MRMIRVYLAGLRSRIMVYSIFVERGRASGLSRTGERSWVGSVFLEDFVSRGSWVVG